MTESMSSADALDMCLRAIEEYGKNALDISDEAPRDMRAELE